MVKIIPEELEDINIPDSEKIFFGLLQSLSDDWIVWHSREWVDTYRNKQQFGESDFLVFKPKYGFLVLEVKGGGIIYRNGEWYTKNKKGIFKIHDPFRQANRCKHFFRNHYINSVYVELRKNPSLKKNNYLRYGKFPGNFNYGVIFPQSPFKDEFIDLIPSVDSQMVFDSDDIYLQQKWMKSRDKSERSSISHLESYLINLFKILGNLLRHYSHFPPKFASFFPKTITPSIKTRFQLNTWIEYQNIKMEKVNQEQDKIIELLEKKKKCFFTGSAGTGKTYIGIKKMIKDYQNNKSILYLCYNRNLKYQVRNLFQKLHSDILKEDENETKLLITNIDSFIYSIFKYYYVENFDTRNKNKFDNFGVFLKNKKFQEISDEIKEIFSSLEKKSKFKFDTIIVDEAQDIQDPYWELISLFLQHPKNSTLYAFYDPDQAIFNNKFTIKKFGFDIDNDVISLNRNLRNGDKIVDWFTVNTKLGNYSELSGFSGQEIDVKIFTSFKQALDEAVISIFKYYFDSKIKLNQMLILGNYKLEYLPPEYHIKFLDKKHAIKKYRLKKHSKKFNLRVIESKNFSYFDNIYKKNQNNLNKGKNQYFLPVQYSSIGAFKGLEKPIIFLLIPNPKNVNEDEIKKMKKKLYIGASRAKFILLIYYY